MARFGKLPVQIKDGVTATIAADSVEVKGPKGTVVVPVTDDVKITQGEGVITIALQRNSRQGRSMHGTLRSHIKNAVEGVTTGWSKSLEIVGAGYRAEVRGRDLVLTVGYSHPVTVPAPEGITFGVEKQIVTVSGVNREMVGQVSALVRAVRPPEPYNGSGIKYTTEVIRRKAGKQAAKAA